MRKPLIKYLDEHWTKPCESWITPEEPYNYSIPYSVVCARWRAGKLTLEARKYKKSLKRQWRGLEWPIQFTLLNQVKVGLSKDAKPQL